MLGFRVFPIRYVNVVIREFVYISLHRLTSLLRLSKR